MNQTNVNKIMLIVPKNNEISNNDNWLNLIST